MCPILLSQAGQEDWALGRLQVLRVQLQEAEQVGERQQELVEGEEDQLQVALELVPQVAEPQQLRPPSPDQALDLRHTAPLP